MQWRHCANTYSCVQRSELESGTANSCSGPCALFCSGQRLTRTLHVEQISCILSGFSPIPSGPQCLRVSHLTANDNLGLVWGVRSGTALLRAHWEGRKHEATVRSANPELDSQGMALCESWRHPDSALRRSPPLSARPGFEAVCSRGGGRSGRARSWARWP